MSGRQQNLFDTEPAQWELDDVADRVVATIVLPEGPRGVYDYLVPDNLRSQLQPGCRVRVPLGRGNRPVVGYCVRVDNSHTTTRRLKAVKSVVDSRALLTPAMLKLTEWIAEYYLCDWGQVLEAVLPAGVRSQAGTREVTLLSAAEGVAERLDQLKLPPKQARALEILAASPQPLAPPQLAAAAACTLVPIHALRKKGLVRAEVRRVQHTQHEQSPAVGQPPHTLNDDQQQALDPILKSVQAGRYQTVLVHGVTGSGKTEVYIRAIEQVLRYGRQAIVLVPEISLTPQTRQRFRSRFEHVAVMHSHLSASERHWHWQRIARGEVQVVVGARSAIFAPVPRLGLIVLDEEHDGSFKQDTAPRYHAREVAIQLAREEKVPLVLGSATPSLDSWHRARQGEFRLVEMPRRVLNRPLPDVAAIDLRSEFHNRRSRGAVSRQMHQAIDQALRDDGQVILLLNRRGFSTHIQCPACGEVVRCEHCDIALTHHRKTELAVCHYCDYQVAAPPACPKCHFEGIRYSGQGTERLEAEIRARFPEVACLRMDSDSMQRPGSHEQALSKFRSGKVQILLGTQMIAKGLDFPNVTLVGVINADTALHFPDFRAAERTFHLVTQVAGRTGRGEKGGRVLVQTFSPEHPAIMAAMRHDYAAFAKQEMPTRREYGYPPYTQMIRLVVRGTPHSATDHFAQYLGRMLNEAAAKQPSSAAEPSPSEQIRVLGPTAAPIAKLRGKFRFHMLIQGPHGGQLHTVVRAATADLKPPDDVQWIVDVDPLDML